jgi:2-(1,2-epoxy-1,2-dihydrophenyl)acetyl-CoA isomerase
MSVLNLETIECRRSRGIAWLILNRPDALNAWTRQLGEELTRALEDVAADRTVRAVVVTGAGRTELREVYHPLILRVRTLPKPVIAAVNGPAVGIGASLALASDLIVAARSAYFLMAFVNIGLGLDGGASHTLVARVGHARAFEIAYLGERIAAETALGWGLVNEVVADDQLESRVGELAERLAAGPPGSYAAIKRTINARAYTGFAELLDLEADVQQERAESKDFGEGVMAFLEKRRPEFTGD